MFNPNSIPAFRDPASVLKTSRLQLGVLAYSMLNFMKRFALPPEVRHRWLQSIP